MLNKPVLRVILATGALVIPALSQSTDPKSNDAGGNGPPAWVMSKGSKDDRTKDEKKRDAMERPVTGFVTDADGKPVSGAVVQLKNTRTLQVRSFITREKGDYYFAGLNKDVDYELKAQSAGKASSAKTLSSFDTKAAPVINLQIK
jgi:hypothetical protein